jgi:hypothetical protein
VIEGLSLDCHGLVDWPQLVEDVEFRRCTVERCHWPPRHRATADPADRPVVRHVKVVRCHATYSHLSPIVAEDCEIDTVWFHNGKWGPTRIVGSAFRHVVIKGKVTGSIVFTPSPRVDGLRAGRDVTNDPYVVANRKFYEGVDWALDIREASFTSVEFSSGIPAGLIRRDPETQVVLRRASVADGRWRNQIHDVLATIWIEDFLTAGFPDTILVAGKRGKSFANEMAAISQLREAGLVE